MACRQIHQLFVDGRATKDNLVAAFRSQQAYIDRVRSDHGDAAAAYDDEYKYY